MAPTKDKEEPKQTLPVGHPQAGYVSPDLSLQDGVGTLPDEEQEAHDERDEAREAEIEAVTENEDKVAKAEAKAAEERDQAQAKAKDESAKVKPAPKSAES